MCTVTFIPVPSGFQLGMNRDEQRSRAIALPPRVVVEEGRKALLPSEPSGGTWLGAHESGMVLALVNWYAVGRRVEGQSSSRGWIVRHLLFTPASSQVQLRLKEMNLSCVNPFRLIGFFPDAQQVVEWRWNLETLEALEHPWGSPRTWISSGFDEQGAERRRRVQFEQYLARTPERGAGVARWLDDLHASHGLDKGAYSHCMHRDDAVTVSYTQVAVDQDVIRMRYRTGSPCERSEFLEMAMLRSAAVTRHH